MYTLTRIPNTWSGLTVRLTIALMMVIVMLGFTQQATFADNFSCGDLNNNHCYALDRWYIGPPDYGSFTEEQVVNLSCTCNNIIGGETGFINNEVWVSQDSNSACGGNVCWVEAGYSDSGGIGGSLHYFWADQRPNGGYHGHDLNSVPSGDLNGNLALFLKKVSSSTWDVDLESNTYYFAETSTSNSMVADRTDMGTELAGSGTVSAPKATWSSMAKYLSQSNWNSASLSGHAPSLLDSPLKFDYTSATFDTHCC